MLTLLLQELILRFRAMSLFQEQDKLLTTIQLTSFKDLMTGLMVDFLENTL